jgi:hypothetical protein
VGDRAKHQQPAARGGLIVERLPGETLVYDEAHDTVHCLSGAAATVFELCDGTRDRAALTALAGKRLGRPFARDELDEVLSELQALTLLDGEGMSRRQAFKVGGGLAAAGLITTIVAPVPAAAQSPTPPGIQPGSPGAPCQTTPDCNENLNCVDGQCCVPLFDPNSPCVTSVECCGFTPGGPIQCVPLVVSPGNICVDSTF